MGPHRNVATERGRDLVGVAVPSSRPSQCFPADHCHFSPFDTNCGPVTDLLKETPAYSVGEAVVSGISHLTPPFSVFFSSQVCLRGGRGGKGSSSILMGSLTRSLAEVSIHPRGCLKYPEPSLNDTSRWVGVCGRKECVGAGRGAGERDEQRLCQRD